MAAKGNMGYFLPVGNLRVEVNYGVALDQSQISHPAMTLGNLRRECPSGKSKSGQSFVNFRFFEVRETGVTIPKLSELLEKGGERLASEPEVMALSQPCLPSGAIWLAKLKDGIHTPKSMCVIAPSTVYHGAVKEVRLHPVLVRPQYPSPDWVPYYNLKSPEAIEACDLRMQIIPVASL